MLVEEIFQSSVSPLSPENKLADLFPEDFPDGIQFIPVIEEKKFLGFLPLENLDMDKEIYSKVGECDLEISSHFIHKGQHIFEAIPLFQKSGISVLPVLGIENEYEGVLRLDKVFEVIANSFAFQSDGGVIVLSVASISYSLSEISRLVESNQAKVLSVVVEADPIYTMDLFVHLKINQTDLSRVVATLERFDYKILEVHHKSDFTSVDQDRLDQLMKYLGI